MPDATPVADADDHLARARALVERAIRRRWSDGMLTRDPDGVFTAILGAEHVERLMQPPQPIEGELLDDHVYPTETPLGGLVARVGAAPSEGDLFAVLLACETDPITARLCGYLGGNQAQFTITGDLLFEIVYRMRARDQSTAAALMHADLAPHGRSRRLKLLLVDGADSRAALAQGLRLHPRLTGWLLGQRALDAELGSSARLLPPIAPPESQGALEAGSVEQAARALRERGRLLLIDGPARSGREMLLHAAAASLDRPLLVMGCRGLTPDRVVAAFREAALQGALLAFHDVDELLAGDALARLRECLEVSDGTVAIVGAGATAARVAGLRPTSTVEVKVPPHEQRLELWRRSLGDDSALDAEECNEVASLYNLGVAGIVQASRAARERAAFERRPVGRADVALAVRHLFDADLAVVASRAEVSQSWDDVVLPDDLGEAIIGILDRIRFRNDVLGTWGFARKVGKGLGLTVLFSGEPGTGKSMVAGLIARELGLDLYVIDLSRVTSKWLGETEKNLARAFDAAEAGHVVLLFDEADTILGRRSADVRSSNDRHANLETNFILARLEQFQGIAFFTTNLASAIDPAVSRRMSANLKFPFPDVELRAELWRRMIPKEVPLDGEIDFHRLAESYELSGGFIRNIVLRAAYIAAREGTGVSMAHLERAARAEYTDRGSLLEGGRLV